MSKPQVVVDVCHSEALYSELDKSDVTFQGVFFFEYTLLMCLFSAVKAFCMDLPLPPPPPFLLSWHVFRNEDFERSLRSHYPLLCKEYNEVSCKLLTVSLIGNFNTSCIAQITLNSKIFNTFACTPCAAIIPWKRRDSTCRRALCSYPFAAP